MLLYLPQGDNTVQAIDAVTGEIIWRYKPGYAKSFQPIISSNRGLGLGDGRLYMGQLDGNLVALDQKTGALVWKTKLGRPQDGYGMTSSALYYDGMVIQGMSGGDCGRARLRSRRSTPRPAARALALQRDPAQAERPRGWSSGGPRKRAFIGGGAMWNQYGASTRR